MHWSQRSPSGHVWQSASSSIYIIHCRSERACLVRHMFTATITAYAIVLTLIGIDVRAQPAPAPSRVSAANQSDAAACLVLYDKARTHLDNAYDRNGCLVLRARLSFRKTITFSSIPPTDGNCG